MSKSTVDIETVIIDLERADCLLQLAFEEVETVGSFKDYPSEEAKTAMLCFANRSNILHAVLDSVFDIVKKSADILTKEVESQYSEPSTGTVKIPVAPLRMMSDFKWQYDGLMDRINNPDKYRMHCDENVEETVEHLKQWLRDHIEGASELEESKRIELYRLLQISEIVVA